MTEWLVFTESGNVILIQLKASAIQFILGDRVCLVSAQNGLKTAIVIRIMGSKNLISERHMN